VSISAVGTVVTAYALALAIGGLVLTALTIKPNRWTVLPNARAHSQERPIHQ
jgi:predicted MFS family arabinose efflux permease